MGNKPINNFTDLEAWNKAHLLVLDVYKISKNFPKDELYGITNQLRRAASSVTANIAEGFARYHFKEKIKFYYNSRGSVAEVQDFLLLAKDLNYINEKECNELFDRCNEVGRLVNGLIKSIEKQK